MFMVSVRLTRKRMLLGALAVALLVSAGVAWSKYRSEDAVVETAKATIEATSEKPEKATTKKAEAKPEKKAKVDSKKAAAKTNEQRLAFIESFGWEVQAEPVEVMEVIIPKEFDEVYTDYNAIQKMQGCDLSNFAGKRCKRYSYEIVNYPNQPENVRINILVINNKIVGGDVASIDAGGFMHGFALE